MVQRTVPHRLGGGVTVFGQNVLFQRAGVDTDANRNVLFTAGNRHRAHPLVLPDVAGVDANLIDTRRHAIQRQTVIKMNVRHQRHIHRRFDGVHQPYRLCIRNGDAKNVASRRLQRFRLRDSTAHIRGGTVAHRLHRDRRRAAHRHPADKYRFTCPTLHCCHLTQTI